MFHYNFALLQHNVHFQCNVSFNYYLRYLTYSLIIPIICHANVQSPLTQGIYYIRGSEDSSKERFEENVFHWLFLEFAYTNGHYRICICIWLYCVSRTHNALSYPRQVTLWYFQYLYHHGNSSQLLKPHHSLVVVFSMLFFFESDDTPTNKPCWFACSHLNQGALEQANWDRLETALLGISGPEGNCCIHL